MIEILPIKLLTDEDAVIFGRIKVALGKLAREGLPVAPGLVTTAPSLHLKTVLEHFAFASKEVFEQSLTLAKKEIAKTPVPEVLQKELAKRHTFFLEGREVRGIKQLWLELLGIWLEEIKQRIWKEGFYQGITEGLEPQIIIFAEKIKAWGKAFFDPLQDDVVVNTGKGNLHPVEIKKLVESVQLANKKLFIPNEYEWILDGGVKFTGLTPYTPAEVSVYTPGVATETAANKKEVKPLSTVKIFLDLSTGLSIEKNADGIYISSEKIFDLNKPRDSFEDLLFKLVESATTFPDSSILFKLADKSEGMGKIRGTLRLLHQQSLFEPMVDALDFTRHKKSLTNVHIVVPFVRGVNEFLQIKRDLAVKKLSRKNSLQLWMEICTPENTINLEDYLVVGLDGIILNLDELVSFLNGFDSSEGELIAYKNEISGLLKFLEDGLKLLHKSKIPFIAYGSLSLYPQVLEFLVEKGVYGIVVERYEAPSAKDLLHQAEKRLVFKRAS